MKKTCPRCNSSFECNHGNIVNCGCVDIPLDKNMRQYIADNYNDCLCFNCLSDIKENFYTIGINLALLKQG